MLGNGSSSAFGMSAGAKVFISKATLDPYAMLCIMSTILKTQPIITQKKLKAYWLSSQAKPPVRRRLQSHTFQCIYC